MARLLAALLVAACAVSCGGDEQGPRDAEPAELRIAEPGALELDASGGLYVADRALHRVVRIDLASRRRSLAVSGIRDIVGLALDDMGQLYVGTPVRIYRVDGTPTLIAGDGRRGQEGDLGPATEASLGGVAGFEVDHDETVVIAEYDNAVRFVHPDGIIETLAGTGKEGYAGDGGPARQALVAAPHDVAVRRHGVVVADSHNRVLRFISDGGWIETLARGFIAPIVVEGGPGNTLYVADGEQNAIFRLEPPDWESERVGEATVPIGLAVDGDGTMYVSELEGERRVLRIAPDGTTSVLSP